MKVSVIIPIYNMEQYLEECLNSVVTQTLKEIEIICINDGSTDDSLLIIKRFQNHHHNIIIVNQDNLGTTKARNIGLDIANGEFVAFMDPDDYYPENDVLESLYVLAKKHNVKICGGSVMWLRSGRFVTEFTGLSQKLRFKESKIINYYDYQFPYGYTRFIFDLKMIQENGLAFPLYIRYEDPPFFVRAMLLAGKFYATSKITYVWRRKHKKVNISDEVIAGNLKGFLDLLSISKKHRMTYLHSHVVQKIHTHYSYHRFFIRAAISNSIVINNLITAINNEIDKTLLIDTESLYFENPKIDCQKLLNNYSLIKDNIITRIKPFSEIFIYGAGHFGKSIANYLSTETNITIAGFAVTTIDNSDIVEINEIPLKHINELNIYYENALFIVGVRQSLKNEIIMEITKRKIKNYLLLSKMETNYINAFYDLW